MSSQRDRLTLAYYELSSLYKNPMRPFRGIAAANVNLELAEKQSILLDLFLRSRWSKSKKQPAIYYKVLSLLYELDDYRGKLSSDVKPFLTNARLTIEAFRVKKQRASGVML